MFRLGIFDGTATLTYQCVYVSLIIVHLSPHVLHVGVCRLPRRVVFAWGRRALSVGCLHHGPHDPKVSAFLTSTMPHQPLHLLINLVNQSGSLENLIIHFQLMNMCSYHSVSIVVSLRNIVVFYNDLLDQMKDRHDFGPIKKVINHPFFSFALTRRHINGQR